MSVATTSFSWLPALTQTEVAATALACVLLWLLLRFVQGRSLVSKRVELVLLRVVSLGIFATILFGPTIIDEQVGTITRPEMMLVYDGSQSMQLGREASRWDAALQFANDAQSSVDARDSENCRSFRFGHQLQPLSHQNKASSTEEDKANSNAALDDKPPANATDSRLADALKQLLPQTTTTATSGVVLLSDGRVRATDTVEKLAEVFGESKIPIHVVPIGESTGTGDVAVVSMVVPSRVRKFTENEMQVFLRSFGYSGQGTTVSVRRKSNLPDEEGKLLAEVPVTLRGGAQSVSLTFRVDEQPEELVVSIAALPDELTTRNNRVTTKVGINRTKVRVLYVEGTPAINNVYFDSSSTATSSGFTILDAVFSRERSTPTSNLDLRTALQSDTDVECAMLVSRDGRAPIAMESIDTNTRVFPKTRAELFAYDCVIFSNVGPEVISEQQAQWLAQWVEGRGGGLIVCGSKALQQASWTDSPLRPLLPVQLANATLQATERRLVEVAESNHPVWRLRLEQNLNDSLLQQLPELSIGLDGHAAKPSADILATESGGDAAVLMAHRAGRGRVLVSTADLAGQALSVLADNWGSQPERSVSKLWRNMVYWTTEGSSTGRRRLVATSDKRFYRPGDNLEISATAYDEAARQGTRYRIWAMFEPLSLDDMSIYSPILWPENVVRDSGEVGPRIAWGEELKLKNSADGRTYFLPLQLSETGTTRDSGFRIEMTAYEGEDVESSYGHGTQVDSTSLSVQILSDPFEQQNPLPNHELLRRVASLSGGSVLQTPQELAELLQERPKIESASIKDLTPAWDEWWLWLCLAGTLTTEWCWRRLTGLA